MPFRHELNQMPLVFREEMESSCKSFFSAFLCFLILQEVLITVTLGKTHYRNFEVTRTRYSRLCSWKSILTINGQFPGPTIYARKGETVIVNVHNKADENVTLHWHGVLQPRNPWSDGPSYITQCPIQPRASFKYKIILTNEEGTLWWHAHSEWTRATVHGAIIIYPKLGTKYPFPKPYKEVPIIIGSWWKKDVDVVRKEALRTGGGPDVSDAYTINGQPGDLYPCSNQGTFRLDVKKGNTYLLRIINAGMDSEHFFAIAKHKLTVVGTDGTYVKPLTTNFIMITPGQTMDILLKANQPYGRYYMAAQPYASDPIVPFNNSTATAVINYTNKKAGNISSSPSFPSLELPDYNDTTAATKFLLGFRSLANNDHPISVPSTIDKRIKIAISMNLLPCIEGSLCEGPNGTRVSASMNNVSFVPPSIDILSAYYKRINGVFGGQFPSKPPSDFNFTGDDLPLNLLVPKVGTEVKFLKYNSSMEIVIQGTNVFAGENHPVHLHGYSFYVVGIGFGNFHEKKDPLTYNLVDPPELNTIGVPKNGWVAIRFRANNPGVWFMHCHVEQHLTWGMGTAFIVKNGVMPENQMLSPPHDRPPC